MKKIECACGTCGVGYEIPLKEYNRKLKLGSKFYCSRSCSSKSSIERLKTYDNAKYLNRSGSKKDKYSIVREHLNRAKRRVEKGDCNLTLDYLLELWESQEGKCAISGIELIPVYTTSKHERNPDLASLDRIDCSLGYLQGNVRFVSNMANIARNCWSDEKLIDFCKKVVEFNS